MELDNDKLKKNIEDSEANEDTGTEISKGKGAFLIVAIVILVFLIILFFTDTLGGLFGKKVENAVLIVIAVMLGLYLYKLNRREK